MQIEEQTTTLRVLTPAPGHVLIKGDTAQPESLMIARERVILAPNDPGSGWREITLSELESLLPSNPEDDETVTD